MRDSAVAASAAAADGWVNQQMIPETALQLALAILKLVTLLIESKPPEVRQAEALLAWRIYWRVVGPMVGEQTRKDIEEIIAGGSK